MFPAREIGIYMNIRPMDDKDRELVVMLQEGMPITPRPYSDMARKIGISEDELFSRAKKLKDAGIVKRRDLRLDLKKIGLVTTLVACKIPGTEIQRAREVILNCQNVTHNYLRKHDLNMWFTLYAASEDELQSLLAGLKNELKADRMLSLETKEVFKLKFRLNMETGRFKKITMTKGH